MSKAEQFIKDCTNHCSNLLVFVKGDKEYDYAPWITPEQALAAVEIAREEMIDTLEAKKEVDLKKELSYEDYIGFFKEYPNFPNDWGFDECWVFAKYFFELGLKAKDWVKERMEECPYRQVGCTMYEGKILECRGACSWVVDYLKLKELKAQKGE